MKQLAKELQNWAKANVPKQEAWSAPIWFVYGTLLGIRDYRQLAELELPPRPPANGLTKCSVVLPPKVKIKKHAGGIEVKNRGVTLFILEIDAGHEAAKVAQWNRIISQEPVYLGYDAVYEADKEFAIGQATGFKFICRTEPIEGKRAEIREYYLTLGATKLLASVMSNRKFDKDLDEYEAILASLRLL
ncbi:MAG TPA: hypothetical protein VHM90_05785 [Phycisphaerae bacterium]|nr:hypothetical protein [Phycisphaerae bacterium]